MALLGFTVVAGLVLALGIGANSVIFGLVSAVWLKRLTFADAERLVKGSVWFCRWNSDPAAVGRTIDLDGSPHTVVGDVPRDFRFGKRSGAEAHRGMDLGTIRRLPQNLSRFPTVEQLK